MDSYVVTVGALGLLVLGGIVASARVSKRRWREQWQKLAEDLGGTLNFWDSHRTAQVTAVVDGIDTEVCEDTMTTMVTCRCVRPAPAFLMHRRKVSTGSRYPLPGVSEPFDAAFAIEGPDRKAITALLTPEIQTRLLSFVGRVFSEGGVACDGTHVRLYKSALDREALLDAVQTATTLARAARSSTPEELAPEVDTTRAPLPVARLLK